MPCLGFDHRRFTHAVQFYLDESFLTRMTGNFAARALSNDSTAIFIATPKHHEAFAQHLQQNGLDIAALTAQGRYLALDAYALLRQCTASEKIDSHDIRQLLRQKIQATIGADKSSSTFIFGELVALLCAEGKFETALAVEQVWETLIIELPIHLLCAYPIKQFAPTGTETYFPRVCSAHQTVISPDAYPNAQAEKRILAALSSYQT